MKEKTLVTTDADFWNSADGSGFFVMKNQVKELPEYPSPITEDALSQGLLREATREEIRLNDYEKDVEEAVKSRKIEAGHNYEDTVSNYERFLLQQKSALASEPKKKDPKPEKLEKDPEPEKLEADPEPNKGKGENKR